MGVATSPLRPVRGRGTATRNVSAMSTTRHLLVLAVVLLVPAASGCGVFEDGYERASTVRPLGERLTVLADSGDVDVSASPDGDLHVIARVAHRGDRPQLTEESTPTGVVLESRCPVATACSVDYEVQVPAAFTVQVTGRSGGVAVSGVTGPLSVDTDSGDIRVSDVTGDLDLRTGSGQVVGSRVGSGAVLAGSGSGDVRLDLSVAPREVRAETSSGAVEVVAPGGRVYRVDARSGAGEERVDVPVDPAAPASIRAASNSGDVTVRAR